MKGQSGNAETSRAIGADAGWAPPENPDPQDILAQAKQDTASGRYEDALAKHLWFHENALEYRSSLYGVRLSFALGDWTKLSHVYPLALDQMKAMRDKAETNVRNGVEPQGYFRDLVSLNERLGEEQKTTELFLWLDQNQPESAVGLYRMAQCALIKSKVFEPAGRYIDPQSTFERIVAVLNAHREYLAIDGPELGPERKAESKRFCEEHFCHSVATLVALLVLNGKGESAKSVSEKALLELDHQPVRDALANAQSGVFPAPWP